GPEAHGVLGRGVETRFLLPCADTRHCLTECPDDDRCPNQHIDSLRNPVGQNGAWAEQVAAVPASHRWGLPGRAAGGVSGSRRHIRSGSSVYIGTFRASAIAQSTLEPPPDASLFPSKVPGPRIGHS